MTLEELLAVAEIVEKLTNRYRDQEAAHKAALTEIRASFVARTGADENIIEGLRVQVQDMREEIIRVNEAHGRTKVVHDGLLDELAVQRDAFTANVERIRCEGRDALRAEVAALQERLRASIARGDFAQMEVAALKSQIPKHPVKVGEWVKSPLGTRGKVVSLGVDYLEVELTNGPPTRWWPVYMCKPCDPPATHDTDAGKAAAESAVKAEPVAEEIKVGDVAKVVGASGDLTAQSDIGKIGEVLRIDFGDGIVLLLGAGWVNRCDVRKVTT